MLKRVNRIFCIDVLVLLVDCWRMADTVHCPVCQSELAPESEHGKRVRGMQSNGGFARWQGVSDKAKSRAMRAVRIAGLKKIQNKP